MWEVQVNGTLCIFIFQSIKLGVTLSLCTEYIICKLSTFMGEEQSFEMV